MKRIFFIFWVLLLSFGATQLYAAQPSPQEIFSRAQSLFEQGLSQKGIIKQDTMLKSALAFQSLLQDYSIENGYLFYNTGNAFFEAGKKGKAILYYKKAQRFISANQDLQYNLKQAQRKLNLTLKDSSWWEESFRGFFSWHDRINLALKKYIFLLFFTLFWLVLFWMLFKKTFFQRIILIGSMILCFGFALSWSISWYRQVYLDEAIITSSGIYARKGPGFEYEKYYEQVLNEGLEVVILEQRGDWMEVRLLNGDQVWLSKESIERM